MSAIIPENVPNDVPRAEAILSYLSEMSTALTVSYPVGLDGRRKAFVAYSLPIPPLQVLDVGYDRMSICLKSPRSYDYGFCTKTPTMLLGAITMQANMLNPIELPKTMAEEYFIVPESSAGHLAVVKTVDGVKATPDLITIPLRELASQQQAPWQRVSSLPRRINLFRRSKQLQSAEPEQKVLDRPVVRVSTAERRQLFDLLQAGVARRGDS